MSPRERLLRCGNRRRFATKDRVGAERLDSIGHRVRVNAVDDFLVGGFRLDTIHKEHRPIEAASVAPFDRAE